jgi:hypothetical protein
MSLAAVRAHLEFTRSVALAGLLGLALNHANAQTPGVLYTWPSGTQDWFRNFGAGNTSAILSNSGGALQITETSAAAGGSQAFTDGFNTSHDSGGLFFSGGAGGLDVTGLSSLQFTLGHNGSAPINVQFFTQATPGANFVPLGPDISVTPGMNTYTVPLTGLTLDQQAYMRTIGVNIRDHAGQGNVTWTLDELSTAGTPLTSRVIADHDGGPADFDGVIANFDTSAIAGANGGQNNSGMSIVGGALQWKDLGGGPGAAITWGNGTQNSGGGISARPVDLSNYDFVTIRMSATGLDPALGIQYYMQTGGAFTYQSINDILPVDGAYHDLVFPLAGITDRSFVDTNGINLFGHTNDLIINVDSVIYSMVPEPTSLALFGFALLGQRAFARRTGRASR